MKPENEVREDLNNIRYYYAHRKEMDEGYLVTGEHEIMQTVRAYNDAMRKAPLLLYDVYVRMYIRNGKAMMVAVEMNYSDEYIRKLKRAMIAYLCRNVQR